MKREYVIAVAAIVLQGLNLQASAGLLAYEGFDYSLVGANLTSGGGGEGFVGQWYPTGFNASNQNNYMIADGSLPGGDLLCEGNRMYSGTLPAIGGIGRNLASPIGAAGTTRYMSFLVRPEGVLNVGQWSGYFGVYLDGTANDMFVGKPGGGVLNEWVLEHRGGGSNQRTSGVDVVINQTVLLVVKAEFTLGNDTFTLYVNPTPGEAEPFGGTVLQSINVDTVNTLVVYSTGEFSMDEIRIGDSFADVTPVPEVGTLTLVGLGGLYLRRRKCTGSA